MHALAHPDRGDTPSDGLNSHGGASGTRTALPFHWYFFFGIIEPLSVAAGSIYAIFFQERYHAELVPLDYTLIATKVAGAGGFGRTKFASGISPVARERAAAVFVKADMLGAPTRMALSQLGSCYFLIMLNSALVFFALRRHLSKQPEVQERILYYVFFVLGAADWTHVFLTIHFLPPATSPVSRGLLSLPPFAYIYTLLGKVALLTQYTAAWNQLLFGNIAITLMLFNARTLWWLGVARDSFAPRKGRRGSNKPLPQTPQASSAQGRKRQ